MIRTLCISNYRSLLKLAIPMGGLNVITGANASGKSNLYRALRLLAGTATGNVVPALAAEGGLASTFWAGPEKLSRLMKRGEAPIQGGPRQKAARLRLGFASDDFGYSISLGVPTPSSSFFSLDPEIKRECIWAGQLYRPASLLVDRNGPVTRLRTDQSWEVVSRHTQAFDSLFGQISDPVRAPEVFTLRDSIMAWRFYDHFRTDAEAPARIPRLGTRTPVLSHDGSDLAAALQTILEVGDATAMQESIADAFPGGELSISRQEDGRFAIEFFQEGLLRPLGASELSDGTLRYLLWVAALMTPRPPPLMVLNEPETSLHPDLLPALARLVIQASHRTQVWVVSHSPRLIAALEKSTNCQSLMLEKRLGQTLLVGQTLLDTPPWHWPDEGK